LVVVAAPAFAQSASDEVALRNLPVAFGSAVGGQHDGAALAQIMART
jgi:hypothetical protein